VVIPGINGNLFVFVKAYKSLYVVVLYILPSHNNHLLFGNRSNYVTPYIIYPI